MDSNTKTKASFILGNENRSADAHNVRKANLESARNINAQDPYWLNNTMNTFTLVLILT